MSNAITLFIIDRNLTSRRALNRLLLAAGFHVQSFDGAKDFFETVEKNPFGGLIVDLDVLDITIQDFMQSLNDSQQNLRIFAISSADTEQARTNASYLGAKGFFRKPVDGNALIDTINWILKPGLKENNRTSTKQDF